MNENIPTNWKVCLMNENMPIEQKYEYWIKMCLSIEKKMCLLTENVYIEDS